MFSFLAAKSDDSISKSLQDLIEDIEKKSLNGKADLIEQFYKLLTGCGYNRIHIEEYRKAKFNRFYH